MRYTVTQFARENVGLCPFPGSYVREFELSHRNPGCLPFIMIYKKGPEILVGNLRSTRTVVSFTICVKFPDCRAALDWILVTR